MDRVSASKLSFQSSTERLRRHYHHNDGEVQRWYTTPSRPLTPKDELSKMKIFDGPPISVTIDHLGRKIENYEGGSVVHGKFTEFYRFTPTICDKPAPKNNAKLTSSTSHFNPVSSLSSSTEYHGSISSSRVSLADVTPWLPYGCPLPYNGYYIPESPRQTNVFEICHVTNNVSKSPSTVTSRKRDATTQTSSTKTVFNMLNVQCNLGYTKTISQSVVPFNPTKFFYGGINRERPRTSSSEWSTENVKRTWPSFVESNYKPPTVSEVYF